MLKYDLSSDAILFMHLPKTAGRSFATVMGRNIGRPAICPFDNWPDLVEHRHELDRYQLYRGHLFYAARKLIPKRAHVVAMFREPADRLYSEYRYILRQKDHRRHAAVSQQTFEDYAEGTKTIRLYTRFLTFKPKVEDGVEDYARMVPRKSSEDALALAKERIDGMRVVGLTEEFEESMSRLQSAFGWRTGGDVPRANVSPPKTDEDEAMIAKAREVIARDAPEEIAIYDYAKEVFARGPVEQPA